MDALLMTKENISKLKKLKLKQYQSPQLLTVEDKLSIEALEKLKYSVADWWNIIRFWNEWWFCEKQLLSFSC
jgi:hypothetical protein